MLNQIVLVGRVAGDVKVKDTENGGKVANITLAVPRSYKNSEGVYDTDFIDCVLWNGVATNTAEYVRKGDLVGVKGRLQSREIEKYHEKLKVLEVVAEKLTFLSSKKENDNTEG